MSKLVRIARKYIGVQEGSGIVPQWAKELGIKNYQSDKGSSNAWCALFVNYMLYKTGLKWNNKNTLSSLAMLNTGKRLGKNNPKIGSLAVWKRGIVDGQGHVGIVSGINKTNNKIMVISGNDDNQVSEREYQLPQDGKLQIIDFVEIAPQKKYNMLVLGATVLLSLYYLDN